MTALYTCVIFPVVVFSKAIVTNAGPEPPAGVYQSAPAVTVVVSVQALAVHESYKSTVVVSVPPAPVSSPLQFRYGLLPRLYPTEEPRNVVLESRSLTVCGQS